MVVGGKKQNTKLMFHKLDPKQIKYNPHYNLKGFEAYQNEHWNTFFSGTEFVLSFWYEGKIAEYIGAYKLGVPNIDKIQDPKTSKMRDRYIFPNMEPISILDEYKNRLFINWTNPSANYGRWLEDGKYGVHSILPSKYNSIGEIPINYYDVKLIFPKIVKLFDYPIDNIEWQRYLSSRAGVYLILDTSNGEQYIGSAYGEEGFWGRWSTYAHTGDGGNKDLKDKDPKLFQFSILWESLVSTNKKTILQVESHFKLNLGTRVHGLNNN